MTDQRTGAVEANDEGQGAQPSATWSKRKKDAAPRGVFRHRSSGVWAIRYACGGGHIHEEQVGTLKSDAIRTHFERRARANDEPGWCPAIERRAERARMELERERQRSRTTFREYAEGEYLRWAREHKRSWRKDQQRFARLFAAFAGRKLDEISTVDVERFLSALLDGERPLTAASRNRYRDLLSAMFKRAARLSLVPANPITGIPKLRETGGRVVYLMTAEEQGISDALPADLRPLFVVSVNTGLRWSEQTALRWRDVDVLSGTITVGQSKNGHPRRVPINSLVRAALVDLSARRREPNDSAAMVFEVAYRTIARVFGKAVQRAQAALRDAGKDAARLDGYTWHGNRHTFASRLVMAGADLLTVKELGGWRTLAMVHRYAHLSPGHLAAAVERLVPAPAATALRDNFDGAQEAGVSFPDRVS